MTAQGSGDSIDRLGPRVSGGNQASDAGLCAGTNVVHPTKTFGAMIEAGMCYLFRCVCFSL